MNADIKLTEAFCTVMFSGADHCALTIPAGHRPCMFAVGVPVTVGPSLPPGDYEISSGMLVAEDYAKFPVVLMTVDVDDIARFCGLPQSEIDRLVNQIVGSVESYGAKVHH